MKSTIRSPKYKKVLLILYVAFLLMLSVSVILMPVGSVHKDTSRVPMFISGAFFWLGLVGTAMMAYEIGVSARKDKAFRSKFAAVTRVGLISFFRNKEAVVADVTMFASVVCFIITRICSANIYLTFVFLSLFVFSFGMHCMLNGKNYIYLNYKVRREEKS